MCPVPGSPAGRVAAEVQAAALNPETEDTIVWLCRDYTFRRHRAHLILEGSGTPPVLSKKDVQLLIDRLTAAAGELDDAP